MTTQELTRKIGEIEPKVATQGEKIEGLALDVKEIRDEQKDQRRLLVVIERLASDMGYVKEQVGEINRRVCSIEDKPRKRWEAVLAQIVSLIVAAAVGYAMSKLGV
jgi:uncharacterized coiled-coil protein SlyX